jgi:hypothetical protein
MLVKEEETVQTQPNIAMQGFLTDSQPPHEHQTKLARV